MDMPSPKPHEAVIIRSGPDGRVTLRRINLRRRAAILLALLLVMVIANGLLWAALTAPGP